MPRAFGEGTGRPTRAQRASRPSVGDLWYLEPTGVRAFRATAPLLDQKRCFVWYCIAMEQASLPLRLAAVVASVGIGWAVALQVNALEASHRQRVAELSQRSSEQRAFAVYVMKQLAGSDEIWAGLEAARQRVYAVAAAGKAGSASLLQRELARVENIDAFAGDANAVESDVIDRFSDRYGPAAVAPARKDLADAVRDVGDETHDLTQALQYTTEERDRSAFGAEAAFAKARIAKARSEAALANLSTDWTQMVARLKAEADDTKVALSKSS